MHYNAVANAPILHHQDDVIDLLYHQDDVVDLLYHCNIVISLSRVSGLSSFKEQIFQFIRKTIHRNLNYALCLKACSISHSSNERDLVL